MSLTQVLIDFIFLLKERRGSGVVTEVVVNNFVFTSLLLVTCHVHCSLVFSLLSVEELLDNDSVEHSEHDHLATDGSREPSSREFEKHYDMLHDIELEKDIYRLRVSIQ